MIPFFTWQCTGWVQGDNTKIILSGLAFCRNHQVNFGGIEQYARAQIKWNGGFSSLLETLFLAWPSTQRGGSLLEEKTSGNVTCGQGCPAPSLHRLDFPLQLSERKEPERFWFWSYFRIITAENIQTAWWLRDFSGFPWSAPEIKAVNTCSSGMINSCWFLLINILITICTFWQFWTQADGDDSRRLQRWFTGRSWPSEATPSLCDKRVSAPHLATWLPSEAGVLMAVGAERLIGSGWLPSPPRLSSPRREHRKQSCLLLSVGAIGHWIPSCFGVLGWGQESGRVETCLSLAYWRVPSPSAIVDSTFLEKSAIHVSWVFSFLS